DTDHNVVAQLLHAQDLGAAKRHRQLRLHPLRRPLDRDRIAFHLGQMTAMRDRRRLTLDACLEVTVDGLDEILAVETSVEAEDRAAEHAVEKLLTPGADAERFGVRPGN